MYKKKPKNDPKSVKEGISAFLKANKLSARFNETMAVALWEELMGQSVAKRTELIQIRQKTLFVRLSSAPLKQELSLLKDQIRKRLNEEVGEDVVSEIVFL